MPKGIERTVHPLRLAPDLADTLQRVDLMAYPGRALRGRGQSRSSDVSSSASTIRSCGVFTRQDCRVLLIDGSEAGTVRSSAVGFGKMFGEGCGGPAPDCTDAFRAPDEDCDPGKDCAAPADSTGAPYDVDWNISAVLAGGAFNFIQFPAVEKVVRACVGAYDGQVYKPAKIKHRLRNTSGYCVLGQFRFNVSGLSCGQVLKWRGNGDTGLPNSTGNAASVVWWSFCLNSGATLEFDLDHALTGSALDCGAFARINGLRATWRCSPDSPFSICTGSAPWNTLSGCAACP